MGKGQLPRFLIHPRVHAAQRVLRAVLEVLVHRQNRYLRDGFELLVLVLGNDVRAEVAGGWGPLEEAAAG